MEIFGNDLCIFLSPHSYVRLHDASGISVRAAKGVLWLTQEGDSVDYVLEPGSCFTIQRSGLTIIFSNVDAQFWLAEVG
mgnify:CR=1 FL=1|jgi:hypothetical protein